MQATALRLQLQVCYHVSCSYSTAEASERTDDADFQRPRRQRGISHNRRLCRGGRCLRRRPGHRRRVDQVPTEYPMSVISRLFDRPHTRKEPRAAVPLIQRSKVHEQDLCCDPVNQSEGHVEGDINTCLCWMRNGASPLSSCAMTQPLPGRSVTVATLPLISCTVRLLVSWISTLPTNRPVLRGAPAVRDAHASVYPVPHGMQRAAAATRLSPILKSLCCRWARGSSVGMLMTGCDVIGAIARLMHRAQADAAAHEAAHRSETTGNAANDKLSVRRQHVWEVGFSIATCSPPGRCNTSKCCLQADASSVRTRCVQLCYIRSLRTRIVRL